MFNNFMHTSRVKSVKWSDVAITLGVFSQILKFVHTPFNSLSSKPYFQTMY